MAEDQDFRDVRDALGRGLVSRVVAEREIPQNLLELLRELQKRERTMKCGAHASQ